VIILDASTIILLAKIDLLEAFVLNFSDKVLIPEKVREEVLVKKSEETLFIERLIKAKKIEVKKVKREKLIKRLLNDFNIDLGEAEAIILALENKISIIATDDRNAIRACKFLNINFTTAIAILVRIFENNLIDKEEALIKFNKLRLIGRYRKEIIEDVRKHLEGSD
jgi:predicted nucleic acid-binding protein